jgi:hypothetical protein
LEIAYLSSNFITSFDAEELFPGNSGQLVNILYLDVNNFTRIGGDSGTNFRGLPALQELSLNLNDNLALIEPDAFSGLTNLISLSLEDNLLTALPPGVFEGAFRRSMSSQDPTRPLTHRTDLTGLLLLDLRRIPHLGLLPQGLFATMCNLHTLYLDDTPYDAFLDNTFSGWGACPGIFAAYFTVSLRELCEAQMAVGIEGSCVAAGCDEGLCDVCASQSSCESKAWCSWDGDGEDAGRCSDPLRAPDLMSFYECARFCSFEVEGATVPCLETEEDFTVLESRSRGSNSWVGFMRAEQDGNFIWVDDS